MFVHVQTPPVRVPRVGQAEKTVSCERCQCNYGYTVYRRAVGEANYSIGRSLARAKELATGKAIARLNKLLENAIEPVPCPACGWVQSAMTREVRRQFARWMIWAGWISFLALLITAVIILTVTTTDAHPITFQSQRLTLDAVALAISLFVGLIGGRYALAFFIDPNARNSTDQLGIPGVPIGYVIKVGRSTRKETNQLSAQEPPGRVTVQLAVAQFPAYCCCCMEKTRFSLKVECASMACVMLPFCKPCAARAKRTTKIACTACAIVGAAVGCGIPIYLSSRDVEAIVVSTCFGAIIGFLFGIMLARFFHPVFVWRFKRERNTVRINFKNHQYADLMRQEGRLV